MMKKMPKGVPNQRLKAERELRGWSQKYVADQIGADHYYLSRWERGTASPSPYYRQKLCTLFGKNAKELGLLQEESSEDLEKQSEGPALSAQAQRAIHDPALPLLSVATTDLIGRDDVLSHLKERLCTGKNVGLTALKGLPGVGKTTLAVALAHDGDVGEQQYLRRARSCIQARTAYRPGALHYCICLVSRGTRLVCSGRGLPHPGRAGRSIVAG